MKHFKVNVGILIHSKLRNYAKDKNSILNSQ